ncbi:DUF559 domain-containing protein [Micromonospora cathayae]|uniref:DUF559 domain-containing protein n=1 Tax=Micromonospora cathayae TaxID=3028804 RepID=A0ABY7ZQP7_9ACTN|nr:DUF559 domain-containing protein [Micromonospora sp. HUAS 3]WDZ84189.1 DUF559 domain-containing protein [Micromonospora sp. HUAS 3]
MNEALRNLVEHSGGVVSRSVALQVVPPWTLQHACATGDLVRVLPGVFAAAHLSTSHRHPPIGRLPPAVGHLAVCAWADGQAVLSHLSALHRWGLRPQPTGDDLHLSAAPGSTVRTRPGVRVHRRTGFVLGPPQVVRRNGLPVTSLDQTVIDSWPLLPPAERHAPVIRAVNDRYTTPERLRHTLGRTPRLAERRALRTLLTRLTEGCRSPLEIWGHEHVFTGPGMPPFRRQVRVQVGRRTLYLDMLAERERVNIELDGATTHGDPRQREIDLRRDALLATQGILVVRFAHRRLVHEADRVRRETLAILASRAT